MSDTEAQAQSSSTAEMTSREEATVSENTTAQDGPLMGSDEAIQEISDIDSYRNAVGSLPTSSVQPDQADDDSTEGDASTEKVVEQEQDQGGDGSEKGPGDGAGDGSQTPPDTGEAGAEQQKPPQYRWRPKSEVDALAMDIIKRAEKSGKEISMKDALVQAETILKNDDSGEDGADTANNFPNTITESEALLADLRAQRKQAFAKDLNFEKAADLDEKIEEIKDHIGSLRHTEALTRQDQETQWNRTLAESKAKAVELYTDVTDPESELVKKMVEIDARLLESGNELYHSPEKPLKLAQMAANELGLPPKKSGDPAPTKTKVASPQPIKATAPAVPRPVPPASFPMSGTARTTQQSNPNGQFAVELDKVTDEESWRAAMSKLKPAAA